MDYARQSSPRLRVPRGTVEGIAAWAVFAVVAVSLRGIRWDEDFEFAQIVTRAVAYPEGHPAFVFLRNVFDLQVYGTAALYKLTGSADFVCAVRNILFVAATVIPAFLLGTLMSGRALCGHVAAVFVLLGTHLEFAGQWPLQTWGDFFSNDHIGMSCALTAACLVAWQRLRLGYFLVGLMPCIDAPQMPALLGLVLVRAIVTARERRWRDLADGFTGAALGLAVCGLFALAKWPFHVALPATGAYAAHGDVQRLQTAFAEAGMGASDVNANLAMLLFLLFALGSSHVERYRRDFQPWRRMFVYGGTAIGVVWATTALHLLLGSRMPLWLMAWMPDHMGNHAIVLLAAGLPAIVAATDPLRGGRVAAGLVIMVFGLLYGIAIPFVHESIPAIMHTSFVPSGEGLFFFLCGAAATLVHAALRDDKPFRVRWTVAAFGALIVVAMHHRFGAACILAGVIVRVGFDRILRRLPRRHEQLQLLAVRGNVLAVVTAVVLAALVFQQWRGQVWLPRTPFEWHVHTCLREQGQANALVVTRPDQREMQARLGHPVMANSTLPVWPVLQPSIGPSVDKLYREIYGIRFDSGNRSALNWMDVWRKRGKDEWVRLANDYGFRYVIAPNHVGIDLPSVLIGETESLYKVPEGRTP